MYSGGGDPHPEQKYLHPVTGISARATRITNYSIFSSLLLEPLYNRLGERRPDTVDLLEVVPIGVAKVVR